ncbi:MAG: hypothetical protein FWD16_02225 [Clostridia bacterium]|nr:hypothetical protein [Clostridia bacterium]
MIISLPTIVVVGGGDLRHNATFGIDRYTVSLAGRAAPQTVFIGPDDMAASFTRVYADMLGCRVAGIDSLDHADIVYIAGMPQPDTLPEILRAGKRGAVICGLGEAAGIFFPTVIRAVFCPHYDENQDFDRQMIGRRLPALGVDNHCAMVFMGDSFRIVQSRPEARAYKIADYNGFVVRKLLDNQEYRPVGELL